MVAPIPKNTVPSTATTTAPATPPPARPPATPPPASDVRRQAADDVHTLQRTSATSAPRAGQVAYQRAVDQAVSAYLEGGGGPLRFQLGQDSATLSALANVDPARLERDLEASFERQATGLHSFITGVDAGSVVSIVESVASDRIRLGIVQEVQTIVNARTHDLLAMRESLPQLVDTLRNARPGTPEAIQARALGIRGDAGDLQRAERAIDQGIEGLQTFLGHMRGQAWWQASDFPDAATRAARRSNLSGALDETIVAGAAHSHRNEQVHHMIEAAEVIHIGLEVGHAIGSAAAAAGLSVSVVGLVAGRMAYEYADEVRGEHVTLGRSLGL